MDGLAALLKRLIRKHIEPVRVCSVGQDRDPDPLENDPIRKNKKWIVDPDPKIAILPNTLSMEHLSFVHQASPRLFQNHLQQCQAKSFLQLWFVVFSTKFKILRAFFYVVQQIWIINKNWNCKKLHNSSLEISYFFS